MAGRFVGFSQVKILSNYILACRFQQCRGLSSASWPKFTLEDHLINRIKASGPLTVATFMQEVLTNPISGYYMNNEAIGPAGDFITSPEVSQVFGELVGLWFVNQWLMSGKNKIQLIELGPGRGTLAFDVLRVFSQKNFAEILKNVSLHLVEVSPALSDIQEKMLTGGLHIGRDNKEEKEDGVTRVTPLKNEVNAELCYKTCITQTGVPVSWYRSIQDVAFEGNTFFLAHEFFDALPVHQFQKTDQGWREVLVDVCTQEEGGIFVDASGIGLVGDSRSCHTSGLDFVYRSPSKLRFVLAPGPTVASQVLVPQGISCSQIEVCPQSGAIIETMSEAIARHGGCALIVDYGEEQTTSHTLRGFKKHALHDVLENPGSADMTADVDFSYLRNATRGTVQTFGPVTQKFFLQQMGIDLRMNVLLKKAKPSEAEALKRGFTMLTSPSEMGNKFKVFSLVQLGLPEPAAFR